MNPPTPRDVRAFIARHNYTQSELAAMMYLSDTRSVRRYTGGEKPRQMDLARWFVLHARTMLTDEQVREIERAMWESCQESGRC